MVTECMSNPKPGACEFDASAVGGCWLVNDLRILLESLSLDSLGRRQTEEGSSFGVGNHQL